MIAADTAALELLDDEPDMDLLLCPVGGGGLLSGCATIAKHLTPSIGIYGVEPDMVLLAEGNSVKEAAAKLFISPKTIENHRTNIMNKLGLHSTFELVRYAARLGFVDVDLWKE